MPVLAQAPKAVRGVLDLREADLGRVQNLQGEWEFYRNRFLAPYDFAGPEKPATPDYLPVPGTWEDMAVGPAEEKPTVFGYATYRLVVLLPRGYDKLAIKTLSMSTAFSLYADGRFLIGNGYIGKNEADSVPAYLPTTASFPISGDSVELIVQISNYDYRKSGIWEKILLGTEEAINAERVRNSALDAFFFGCLFFMGLYHLGLYLLRRKDSTPLWFGLACFAIALRTAVVGEMIVLQVFPAFPWEIQVKIEFITIFLAFPVFPVLLRALYPAETPKWFLIAIAAISGAFVATTIVLPVVGFNTIIIPYQILMGIGFAFGTTFLGVAVAKGRTESGFTLTGILIMIAAAVNEFLYSSQIIQTGTFLPFGLLGFILFQGIALSSRFSRAFASVESLSERLANTNKSLARFVPKEFLAILGKQDITEVALGDQSNRKLCIVFADIRGFTALSETMRPKENFDFLNDYLGRMGPIIRARGGIVDKYIGDAIMALFPGESEDAVRASIEMQAEVERFNRERTDSGLAPISVGIGIHAGDMMLGTIGEEHRMETTVISDAVNLASRIEGLTKVYGCRVIASERVIMETAKKGGFSRRFLDKVIVQGKKAPIAIYEILDADPEIRAIREATRLDFERALSLYLERDFVGARAAFQSILEKDPEDKAAFIYIDRCGKAIHYGISDGWSGETRIRGK